MWTLGFLFNEFNLCEVQKYSVSFTFSISGFAGYAMLCIEHNYSVLCLQHTEKRWCWWMWHTLKLAFSDYFSYYEYLKDTQITRYIYKYQKSCQS